GNGSRNSGKKEEQKNCFHCKNPGHFIADCPEMSSKDKNKRNTSKKESYKTRIKRSLMATCEDINKLSYDDTEEEEANLTLMASADSDIDSDPEPETYSEETEEVFSNYTKEQLLQALDNAVEKYLS
ncbi:serine/threonine protein kinase SRPK1, partial [Trifolium medium]|nr:serine/threonine protein kinase SRPK1 [Trifolium medium]